MSDIKLKPCPHCGDFNVEYDALDDRVYCCDCGTSGPHYCDGEEAAAEAWNALPRHLQWTTETPTEPGWYWWRPEKNIVPHMVYVVWESTMRSVQKDRMFGEWTTAPISEPQEPK